MGTSDVSIQLFQHFIRSLAGNHAWTRQAMELTLVRLWNAADLCLSHRFDTGMHAIWPICQSKTLYSLLTYVYAGFSHCRSTNACSAHDGSRPFSELPEALSFPTTYLRLRAHRLRTTKRPRLSASAPQLSLIPFLQVCERASLPPKTSI